MTYIPIEDCVHGGLYEIDARNFSYGVWDERQKGFIGRRFKFDWCLFTEFHWDTGEPFGTANPKKFIEMAPEGIEIVEGHSKESKPLRVFVENKALFDYLETKTKEMKDD